MQLPIESVIPNILKTMTCSDNLVIQAPPGAGKTTVVPLSLLEDQGISGKILLIQPRRLAVYGAAHRMASMKNEQAGQTIGFTTRFDSKTSADTQIEVITEGIFLRKIQQDPELNDIGLVIFDEFHERSVTNDLGLAFAIEAQQGYREPDKPLKMIVMSATLDGNKLSHWLNAPLIRSEGRTFPVETFYHPLPAQQNIIRHIAQLILQAINSNTGSILVFLPGMKEINRVHDALSENTLPDSIEVFPLHASLPQEKQQLAIAKPAPNQRKIVLTTNVAETSVTIEGIETVIDSGLVRVSRYDERRSMNVLVTEKISAASAEQRKGRAGRVAKGVCYRAWSESDQRQLKPFSEPEILRADLLPIALEFAIWGCQNSQDLQLLTYPNEQSLTRAQQTLTEMDAINQHGAITSLGSRLAKMGLHPRLALLIAQSDNSPYQQAAIASAAILSEGDPLRFHQQWPQTDLSLRLGLWESTKTIGELHKGTWQRIKKSCLQLSKRAKSQWTNQAINSDVAIALAHAYPEHIGQLRKNTSHRYLLANGKGVQLNPEDNLANTPYLVVLDASGNDKEPFIRLAIALSEEQLVTAMKQHFVEEQQVAWSEPKSRVEATNITRFESLIINTSPVANPDQTAIEHCLLSYIKTKGLNTLPWDTEATSFLNRVIWLHKTDEKKWPEWNDETLLDQLDQWLLPFLAGISTLKAVKNVNLTEALKSYLSWDLCNQIDQWAPTHWKLPTGSKRTLHYDITNGATLNARMQELYGLNQHPTLKNGIPILLDIRSPADRPIQLTKDLVKFWEGSYSEVAKEMRGRYPKHYWPDDPANAVPTTRTKKHM